MYRYEYEDDSKIYPFYFHIETYDEDVVMTVVTESSIISKAPMQG